MDRRARRAAAWPAVERLFGSLPPAVFAAGAQLRHNLASHFSDTGEFADILTRPADPGWLDLPLWLADDTRLPLGIAEPPLVAALTAELGAAWVRANIQDPEFGFSAADLGLADALEAAAAAHWSGVFPPGAPFWETRRTLALDGAPLDRRALLRWAGRAAQHVFPAAPAPDWPRFTALLDRLAALDHTLAECLAVRRDAARGALSGPLRRALHAAGRAADPLPSPEALLGALLLTGTLGQIAAESLAEITACQTEARALALPTLAAALAGLAAGFQDLADLAAGGEPRRPVRVTPAPAGRAGALAMADNFLLADRAFQESWEFQRRGLFGRDQLVGRVFAPGLILEQLSAHRNDLAGEISTLLDRLAADGWRYYPHPAVPPDADDLGLALRLCASSADPARHRAQLARPLTWLAANAQPDGRLPCWLTGAVDDLDLSAGAGLWGGACATVEANLILGLLALGADMPRELVHRAAGRWLKRWQALGLGANAHYTAEYALWAAFQLISALSADPDLRAAAGPALTTFGAEIQPHAAAVRTPQSAALLTLICQHPAAPAELRRQFDPAWISLLLKSQHFDGGWAGEPLYVVPKRGEVAAWYTSRLVTSAFGWRALHAAPGG